jgi:hypothetical protein
MPADIAKAFLNNSEECDFAIFLQSQVHMPVQQMLKLLGTSNLFRVLVL